MEDRSSPLRRRIITVQRVKLRQGRGIEAQAFDSTDPCHGFPTDGQAFLPTAAAILDAQDAAGQSQFAACGGQSFILASELL